MSKVGKRPIEILKGVEVKIVDDNILIKGPKGQLSYQLDKNLNIEIKDNFIFIKPKKNLKKINALWGTIRTIIFNMIKGVTEGFSKDLEIEGVGYKASLSGKKLILNVGFVHPIEINPPEGINFKVEKNRITVFGIDKDVVGQIAAQIRKARPPEPYKGKGIRYLGEKIRRKAGKKAVAAAG